MRSHFFIALFSIGLLQAQTGPGVGLYPTGSETGFGFRLSKDARFTWDARVARAQFYQDRSRASGFVTENSLICRIVKLEKVRFHVGLGWKAEWSFSSANRHGLIVPVGVEAFP